MEIWARQAMLPARLFRVISMPAIFERVQKYLDFPESSAHDLNMFKKMAGAEGKIVPFDAGGEEGVMTVPEERRAEAEPAEAKEVAGVPPESLAQEEARRSGKAGMRLAWLVVALCAGSLMYRLLRREDLTHSAAMFLGLPAVLAILLARTPKAKSLTGAIVKGITFFLLICAPLLGEGYLCILFAAPLFYLVGVIVGLIADAVRRRNRSKATLGCVVVLLVPMCFEGTVPQLSLHREQTVEVTRVVDAPADAVERTLSQSPDLRRRMPGFLRIGFPLPLAAYGNGLELGATRTLHFSGAEGDPEGDLVSRVTERRQRFARMETVSDGTKLTQWVRWESSEVEWRAVDAGHTAVTWRVRFARQLDPAWYFAPWERFTVRVAAGYMIEANAVPERARP